jgi:hypothetical protein
MKHKHLEASQETYLTHLKFAIKAGSELIWVGIASILHGIHPSFFPFTAAKKVVDLYYGRLHDHPNPVYRDYIMKRKQEADDRIQSKGKS